jgi:hypothetical protein
MGVLDDWLSEKEAAAELHKKVRTLRKWRSDGIGPAYGVFGRTVRYHADALRKYCFDQQVTPARSRRKKPAAVTTTSASIPE